MLMWQLDPILMFSFLTLESLNNSFLGMSRGALHSAIVAVCVIEEFFLSSMLLMNLNNQLLGQPTHA
jgi:hypothetical protein